MAGYIAIALATVWTAVVVETIVESARAFGGSILFLRRTVLTPGIRPGVLILCGLAASAGLAWSAAVAYARGRRLERRMAAELDAQYQEITTKAAGDAARVGLLEWRIGELRTSMEDLIERRERIVAEMEVARRKTTELRALEDDYRRSLTELQERLIRLPDIEDELARRGAEREAADPAG
jgi:hypothetical protein